MIQLKQPHHFFALTVYICIFKVIVKRKEGISLLYCTQVIHANKPLIKREYQANKREKFRPEKLPADSWIPKYIRIHAIY